MTNISHKSVSEKLNEDLHVAVCIKESFDGVFTDAYDERMTNDETLLKIVLGVIVTL